jgi:hypothetical protein
MVLDSDFAKEDLRVQRQANLKMAPRLYFEHLQTISRRITMYPERDSDLRNAYTRSLEPRIRSNVSKAYDIEKIRRCHAGIPMTNEWLIEIAIVEDRHAPLTQPTNPPRTVNSIVATVATTEVPVAFRKGALTPEGKAFFQQHGGCFFCRELGHIIPTCSRFAKYKAANFQP